MNKKKMGLGLILLLILPSTMGDLMVNVYNVYVPIFMQAGNPLFSKGQVLSNGFGLGALMVGFWMIADNLLAILIQPFIGAWSDRIRTRLGRRIPFILYTLPLVIIGYALIPLAPRLIPSELSGKTSELVGILALFSVACFIFYLGYMPARVIMQTMRQESVEPDQRPKVEAWFNFLLNIMTILAYTFGAKIYKLHGPLLFWILLSLYVIVCILLAVFFKEPDIPPVDKNATNNNGWKQIVLVLKSGKPQQSRNLYLFLASILFVTLAFGASANFASSWVVNILNVDEAKAASILSIGAVATILTVLPAGYLAGGKIGRRTIYITGLLVMMAGAILVSFIPSLYFISFVLLGIGAGAYVATMLPLLFDLVPNENSPGTLVGIFNVAYLSGFIMGSLVVGAIIQKIGYIALYPSILLLGSSALICILFTNPKPVTELVVQEI
jgi:MFS family permease